MNRKTLRIAALLLVLVMSALMFAGCGQKADSNGDGAKKYTIYSDKAFPPFEYLDEESGEYVGLDMDILAAVAKDQGFEYEVKNEGFDPAMTAVQTGQADGMIAGMTIKPEREETFDFSDGYFEDGSILVVAADSSISSEADLQGAKVAAKTGTVSADYTESIKDKYGLTITYFEDSPSMYQAVMTGAAVACFEDFSVIGWAIKNDGTSLKTVGDVVNPGYYGFAVKKGENSELLELFNAGLANIKKSGEYDKLLAKYGY